MSGRRQSSLERTMRRRHRGGVVLILVMVVVALVSLMGLSFVLTLSTENRATHIQAEDLQLEQVAASGVEWAKALAEPSPDARRERGDWTHSTALFQGLLVIDDDNPAYRARFSILAPAGEDAAEPYRYGLQNESAKLNLATLARWDEAEPGTAQQALMNLPGMTESAAAALLDWIDADDQPRADGAEADYYRGENLPYGPRNAPPTSLDELLLVRDVGRLQLLGLDANSDFTVSPSEQQQTGEAGESATPWASLLTVYSAERNVRGDGRPRIDLNEPDLAKLQQQLGETFDAHETRFIIAYRQFGPSSEPAGAAAAPLSAAEAPPGDDPPSVDLAPPPKFRIESPLDLVGARVQLPPKEPPQPGGSTAEEGEMLESPWPDDPVAVAESLPKLIDATTTDPAPVLFGRINVNLAPREVLLALPGIDSSAVERIVASRSGEEGPRQCPAWPWTEGIVDRDQMRRLLPYLTTEGDVYRGQVVAGFEGKNRWLRAEFVVDATTVPPKQVYWKDLRLLGRAFPAQVLTGSADIPNSEGGRTDDQPDIAID